jgi:hypothetical protein
MGLRIRIQASALALGLLGACDLPPSEPSAQASSQSSAGCVVSIKRDESSLRFRLDSSGEYPVTTHIPAAPPVTSIEGVRTYTPLRDSAGFRFYLMQDSGTRMEPSDQNPTGYSSTEYARTDTLRIAFSAFTTFAGLAEGMETHLPLPPIEMQGCLEATEATFGDAGWREGSILVPARALKTIGTKAEVALEGKGLAEGGYTYRKSTLAVFDTAKGLVSWSTEAYDQVSMNIWNGMRLVLERDTL